MLSQCLWIIVNYTEPLGLKHFEVDWASGWESLCAMLSQWLCIIVCYADLSFMGIMVCYAEPVVVNHCVLCWAVYMGIMVSYAEQVVMNNYVLCGEWCASGCESWWVMLIQWLQITMCYFVPVGVNYGELRGGSVCKSCCVMHSQWLWIMLYYAEHVDGNHGVNAAPMGVNQVLLSSASRW